MANTITGVDTNNRPNALVARPADLYVYEAVVTLDTNGDGPAVNLRGFSVFTITVNLAGATGASLSLDLLNSLDGSTKLDSLISVPTVETKTFQFNTPLDRVIPVMANRATGSVVVNFKAK